MGPTWKFNQTMCMKVKFVRQKVGCYWFYFGIFMKDMSIVNKEKTLSV